MQPETATATAMWFVPGFPESQRRNSWDNAASWGPSLPAAALTGLVCAYVWARAKPWVSPQADGKNEYILRDLTNAKSFLTTLHDSVLNAKAPQQNTETISKAGEDVLLQRTASRVKGGARRTSESITGTLTIGAHAAVEVARLRREIRAMAREEHVYQVSEATAALLQARLPITSSLLSQAFEVARHAIALDPHATLQLGSWGVIMQSGKSNASCECAQPRNLSQPWKCRRRDWVVFEFCVAGEVKLLRLQDGDVPVLLDSFREEGAIDPFSISSPL